MLAGLTWARISVGKLVGDGGTSQARINELLIEHAKARKRVVRLKGGDALLYAPQRC